MSDTNGWPVARPWLVAASLVMTAGVARELQLVARGEEVPDVAEVLSRWTEAPNLDEKYRDANQLPPELHGSWSVVAESKDSGKTVTALKQPKALIHVTNEGWKAGEAAGDVAISKFDRLLSRRKTPDVEEWLLLRGKGLDPYLLYSERGSSILLIRELVVIDAPKGQELTREVRRYAVRVQRDLADHRAVEDLHTSPAVTIPISFLRPWAPGEDKEISHRRTKHNWPKYPETDWGLLVTEVDESAKGIQVHDVIYSIANKRVTSEAKLQDALATIAAGSVVPVKLRRVSKNSKDNLVWRIFDGECTAVSVKALEAERQRRADLQAAKEKEANRVRELEAAERKRRADERRKRIFTLAGGTQITGAKIEQYNEELKKQVATEVLKRDAVSRAKYNQGLEAFLPILRMVEAGDTRQLRDYMQQVSNNPYILRAIDESAASGITKEFVLMLDDGRALTWKRVWEEAVGTLLPRRE